MIKKFSLILLPLLFLIGGVVLFNKNKSSNLKNPPLNLTSDCDFQIKEVYFEESNDPQAPFIKIKGIVGKEGFYKYNIYFPPQKQAPFGIGPIEVGKDEPCEEEKCKPLNPCQEFITQDFISRSYPDNVPEFGKKYFAKIDFYLNNKTQKSWEGEVDWKNLGQKEEKNESQRGKRAVIQGNFQTTGISQAVISFKALPTLSSVEEELQNEWVPSFVGNVIWGYRVYLNDNFYGDFEAVYTPTGKNTYILTDPQSLTLTNLPSGTYYVKIFPLAIYYSPNLVTTDGRRYAILKTGSSVFVWAWTDASGKPTTPWQNFSEIPQDYRVKYGISYPGYYIINRAVFSDYVQVKKSSGGGGGGGGLVQ